MKLEKIENLKEFFDYLVSFNVEDIVASKKNFQNFYYVFLDSSKIGFIDLHYLKGREDSFLSMVFIEDDKKDSFDILELLPLVEVESREMGAKILRQNLIGESIIDSLRDDDWEVVEARYLIEKHLI